MSTAQIQTGFIVDGKIFDTKQAAQDYVRLPKIKAALTKLTNNNTELVEWLIANQETVEIAFEVGTIRRVTKSESNKLAKAVAELKKLTGQEYKGIAFLVENADAVTDSFRWPSVKRMTAEEKTVAARNTLVAASEGREDLAEWIITNEAAVMEAYKAGIEKREVNPAASSALEDYRKKQAALKQEMNEAIEADKAASVEGQPPVTAAVDALKARRAEEKAAADAAKQAANTPATA